MLTVILYCTLKFGLKITNYYISIKTQYVGSIAFGFLATIVMNVLLMLYLFVRNVYRVEKGMEPILNGIQQLSTGKPIHFSMILGYASEIEETIFLPKATRKQAEIIRRNSEKLKDLVSDLHLTTKLEYSIQPIQSQLLNAVELARQAVSEVLNGGLSSKYELELSEDNPGKMIMLTGNRTLLSRMLCNLIQNCIVHNPDGCKIWVSVGSNDDECIFSVIDDGKGISESQVNALNGDQDTFSTQKQDEGTEHGLGLKIVRQIVKAHSGSLLFFDTIPQGLTAKVFIPIEGTEYEL